MAKFCSFLPIRAFYLYLTIISLIIITSSSATTVSGSHGLNLVEARTRSCSGSIAECMIDDHEFDMESEINRRILATTDYISYDALLANTIPCSQRGASYYNCQPGAEANPYDRGCSAITRCRS